MTSAIVSSTIDAAFPVAGQDNNSQGFRDNFQITKDGLSQAATEISALQLTTAKLNVTNDFAGNIIQNAITKKLYGSVATVTQPPTGNLDVSTGDYQRITLPDSNITLTLTNWPTVDSRFAKVRIHLENLNTASRTVTFEASVLASVSDDDSGKFTAHAITVPAGKTVMIEASKFDYGENSKMYLRYLGEFA